MKDEDDLFQSVRVHQKGGLLSEVFTAKVGECAGSQRARSAGRVQAVVVGYAQMVVEKIIQTLLVAPIGAGDNQDTRAGGLP